MEGKLHVYFPSKRLNLFEYLTYPIGNTDRIPVPHPQHVLLFVGGLFDTFNSPEYVGDLAELFPLHAQQKWRVIHIQLSSTIRGWGISDIDQDIAQIGRGVEYIRQIYGEKTNVVLMGHSTGCQDTMHYLTAPNPPASNRPRRPPIQGAILQAPVSDREGILESVKESSESEKAYKMCLQLIDQTPETERKQKILPLNLMRSLFGPAPVSMSRFLSLVSPSSPEKPAIEDFFSSDLGDESLKHTFGRIASNEILESRNSPEILILISDADESMPKRIDKTKLLSRWKHFIEEGGAVCSSRSTSIPNAIHDIGGDDLASREARLISMRGAVMQYLEEVLGDVDETAKFIYMDRKQSIEAEKQEETTTKNLNSLKL